MDDGRWWAPMPCHARSRPQNVAQRQGDGFGYHHRWLVALLDSIDP